MKSEKRRLRSKIPDEKLIFVKDLAAKWFIKIEVIYDSSAFGLSSRIGTFTFFSDIENIHDFTEKSKWFLFPIELNTMKNR